MATMRISVAAVAVVALSVAGCSASHPAAHPSSTSTTVAASVQTTQDAAIELAGHMLDRFVPPPNSSITRAETNLHGPYSGVVDATHIVTQRREWIVDQKADPTLQFLLAHVPAGFRRFNNFSPTKKGQQFLRWDLREEMRPLPRNVDQAWFEIGMVPGTGNLDLTVDTKVIWADPRPAATSIPARDRVVILTFVRHDPDPRVIRRVEITDTARVARIVHAFDSLPISNVGPSSCPNPPEVPITYRMAFATSRDATPDLVAAMSTYCGGGVIVLGRYLYDPYDDLVSALEPELRSPVS